ncbi:transporter substrate-binding domain-containing protein [Virgibacillus necropolis]|uniref:transporter substrate-binding domain-containing protein n=1 Tax=Virgibacillus necropolis TaxID=163877 RepID=UPI00384F4AAE
MKHIRVLIILIAILLALVACSDSSENGSTASDDKAEDGKWAEIQDAGELVVGTSGTLFAASYYPEGSDRITGYDAEVIREIAKRLDLDVKFKTMGIDALLPAVNSNRIDVAINDIEITDDRMKQFSFTDPYKYSFTSLIVRSEDLSGINTLEDLKGKKAGGGATTVFSDIARHFGAEVVTYSNVSNDVYLQDVDNGRTDTVINDYYLQKLALKAITKYDIKIHPDLKFHPTEQGIVVRKDASKLVDEMNKALQEMREDGTLTKLAKKFYGGEDVSKKPEGEIREIEGLDI